MRVPWFKTFASEYFGSPFVQSLDPEQQLWYVRLILASAVGEPAGCLPLDIGKLWRVVKAPSLKYFREHCNPILEGFDKDEVAGAYRVAFIADHLSVCTHLSSKRAQAGRTGAARRWHNGDPEARDQRETGA